MANHELGLLDKNIQDAIIKACDKILEGGYYDQFVVDMIQGGAGTSTNMNANEVIANIGLELMGHKKGEYQYLHPNDHVNLSQSTNDAYPTALHLALHDYLSDLAKAMEHLKKLMREKLKNLKMFLKWVEPNCKMLYL